MPGEVFITPDFSTNMLPTDMYIIKAFRSKQIRYVCLSSVLSGSPKWAILLKVPRL